MSESEFDIIRTYFSQIGESQDWLITSVGDDAAIVEPTAQQDLLISIDTLNVGVHFPADIAAADIGYKSLAVNLSDIAAMGGQPLWFTLAMSLPDVDHEWLREFTEGLAGLAKKYQVNLIGGDTTRGPLSITIQIAGEVARGKALKRSGAKPEDDIYVTGTLGDAAAGLHFIQQNPANYTFAQRELIDRLHRPTPRIEVGKLLVQHASACIDLSDGLSSDLQHILEASSLNNVQLGAEIMLDSIPLSDPLKQSGLKSSMYEQLALSGGDDYELCFTAPLSERQAIDSISLETGCMISRIGKITETPGLCIRDQNQKRLIPRTGYDHFASS